MLMSFTEVVLELPFSVVSVNINVQATLLMCTFLIKYVYIHSRHCFCGICV